MSVRVMGSCCSALGWAGLPCQVTWPTSRAGVVSVTVGVIVAVSVGVSVDVLVGVGVAVFVTV